MPAARYWRAVGLQAVGGGALELSALHLYLSGARVDAAATLTSTVAPASGTLAALQDDATASTARWLDVSAPSFALVWDFGTAQDVNALRLGAGALESEFLQTLALQHSSDGAAWTTLTSIPAFAWPGAGVMQPVPTDGDPHFDKVSLLLHMDGATDSSITTKMLSVPANSLVPSGARFGASGFKPANGLGITTPSHADFALPGDFTFECWFYVNSFSPIYATLLNIGLFSNGALFRVQPSTIELWINGSNTNVSATISTGVWHHIAWSRANGSVTVVLDGEVKGVVSNGGSIGAGEILIGVSKHIGGEYLDGYIDEIRLTKGLGRYTANFTPPTAPFPDSLGGGAATPPAPRGVAQAPAIVLSGGTSAPAGPVLAPAAITRDMQDGGGYCIYGTTELDADPTDVPVRRRVQLYAQRGGRLVRETWSDAATGSYRFDHTRGGDGTRYFVVAFDHTGDKRAVVADNLVPEVMP